MKLQYCFNNENFDFRPDDGDITSAICYITASEHENIYGEKPKIKLLSYFLDELLDEKTKQIVFESFRKPLEDYFESDARDALTATEKNEAKEEQEMTKEQLEKLIDTNTFQCAVYAGVAFLWDKSDRDLGSKDVNDEGFIEWLKGIVKNYNNGLINCSHCGKTIKVEEIAGRYFAGCYCDECWEKEYRYIEWRETYN